MYAVEGTSASLAARNVTTTAAIKKETCVDNDIEAKIRSDHGRDQLTKGRVKPGNKNTVIL